MTVVLSIDPGMSLGWALWSDGRLLEYGVFKTSTKASHGSRLWDIYSFILTLLRQDYVDVCVVENIAAFGKGAKNKDSYLLPAVFGLVRMAAHVHGVEEFKAYAVTSVKKAMTGSGNARKPEVRKAVNDYYGIDVKNDDTADAIAVGHAYYKQSQE